MKSRIAEAIRLQSEPVAIRRAEQVPEGAIGFRPGQRGCAVAFLAAASQGRTAAFTLESTNCPGGRAGLSFCRIPDRTKYFLSTGGEGPREGEFYKRSPALAQNYIDGMQLTEPSPCIVFQPLSLLNDNEHAEAVVFLVNADQLSGLVTLANFDRPNQDNVRMEFGAGCAQSILYALQEQDSGRGKCTIGLTEPSARKVIQKDLLSFSIPFDRFLELESLVDESFLTKETWRHIAERIQ